MKSLLTVSCTNNTDSVTTSVFATHFSAELCKKYNLVEKEILYLSEKKVNYCTGCGCCFNYGNCPLDEDDDMSAIRRLFLKADIIAIITPVYANNVPGIMKSLVDRMISWAHILKLTGKKLMVFTLTHSSGAQYVCNYVSNVFSLMGARLVHFGMLEIVSEVEKPTELKNTIQEKAMTFAHNANITLFYNAELLQKHFVALKASIKYAINNGVDSYETHFWKSSGLLNYSSFLEWESECNRLCE